MLWRQWERLYLVVGVLHRRFHELEGQGWRPQLVVPADRRSSLLQRFNGGVIGAHLGTARTLALAEQGFYSPGMRVDVSRICNECDCAMVCCIESQVERARGCVSRVCCHGGIGPESGRGGTRRGSCLLDSDIFPRFARGSLVKRAGHDGMARGRAPWTLWGGGGGGGGALTVRDQEKEVRMLKLCTTHSTPSP